MPFVAREGERGASLFAHLTHFLCFGYLGGWGGGAVQSHPQGKAFVLLTIVQFDYRKSL